jgi:hypothetical protein
MGQACHRAVNTSQNARPGRDSFPGPDGRAFCCSGWNAVHLGRDVSRHEGYGPFVASAWRGRLLGMHEAGRVSYRGLGPAGCPSRPWPGRLLVAVCTVDFRSGRHCLPRIPIGPFDAADAASRPRIASPPFARRFARTQHHRPSVDESRRPCGKVSTGSPQGRDLPGPMTSHITWPAVSSVWMQDDLLRSVVLADAITARCPIACRRSRWRRSLRAAMQRAYNAESDASASGRGSPSRLATRRRTR